MSRVASIVSVAPSTTHAESWTVHARCGPMNRGLLIEEFQAVSISSGDRGNVNVGEAHHYRMDSFGTA